MRSNRNTDTYPVANPFDQFDATTSGNPFDQFDNGPTTSSRVDLRVKNPGEYDPASPEYQARFGPTAGNSFLTNANIGVGKLYKDAILGMRQLYGQASDLMTGGNTTAGLQQEAADKRVTDAPISATVGGKVGQFAGALPLAFVPGANTYLGAAAIGGGLGAIQPTVAGESRALNTGVGVGMGVAGKYVGDAASNWITQRAQQPFLGWNLNSGNQAAEQAVGSSASKLDQDALAETSKRLGGIFNAARSPDVKIPMPELEGATANAISSASSGLNGSSRAALEANPEIADLMTHIANGGANAQQLGLISSNLGKAASGEMASKQGDRALGQALFAVKEHVDDLIGGSITDPALKAAYDAARPQWRTLSTLVNRPTLLNSSTGDVNLRNLGNYLQKYDKGGYAYGGNSSPLYEAARWGQASTIGSRPPPPILQPVKWATYHAINNPVVGAIGGIASRVGSPISPVIKYGLPGAAEVSAPVALSYLEQ
jgi:hypothetical protein